MIKIKYNNNFIQILENLNSFCGKKDAFDCAGIRAQVFRLPVDCSIPSNLKLNNILVDKILLV